MKISRISQKILILFTVITILFLGSMSAFVQFFLKDIIISYQEEKMLSTARIIEEKTLNPEEIAALANLERLGVEEIAIDEHLEKQFNDKIHEYAKSKNPEEAKGFFTNEQVLNNEFLVYYKILRVNYYDEEGVALVRIFVSYKFIEEYVKDITKILVIFSFFALFLGLVLLVYVNQKIARPLLKIDRSVKRISKFDFTETLKIDTNDEIETLGNNINFLSKELESRIQDLNLANKKLKANLDQDKELMEKQKVFIANISHEIKTPITIINGYSQALMNELYSSKEEKNEYLKGIIGEGEYISNQLDDLINVLKYNSTEIKLQKEKVDIIKLIKEVIETYYIDFKQKNIRLVENYDKNKLILDLDKSKMKQVLKNLLSNAVSFVDNNGEIKVNLFKVGDYNRIEIFNSGSKIEEKDLSHIWDIYYKSEESRNRKYGGLGIGLHICKLIYEKHNIKYGVTNKDNGVCFWFEV